MGVEHLALVEVGEPPMVHCHDDHHHHQQHLEEDNPVVEEEVVDTPNSSLVVVLGKHLQVVDNWVDHLDEVGRGHPAKDHPWNQVYPILDNFPENCCRPVLVRVLLGWPSSLSNQIDSGANCDQFHLDRTCTQRVANV